MIKLLKHQLNYKHFIKNHSEEGDTLNTFGQIQKQSLADLLRSGHRFTPQEISVLMTSAARSLAVRHKNGYIHGHICPETIVIRDCSNYIFAARFQRITKNFL